MSNFDGLKARIEFSPKLIETFALLLCESPLGEFRLPAHEAYDQKNNNSGGNQNGGQKKQYSALALHRGILGPPAKDVCHENVSPLRRSRLQGLQEDLFEFGVGKLDGVVVHAAHAGACDNSGNFLAGHAEVREPGDAEIAAKRLEIGNVF